MQIMLSGEYLSGLIQEHTKTREEMRPYKVCAFEGVRQALLELEERIASGISAREALKDIRAELEID